MLKAKRQQGIALISVLFIAVVLMILMFIFSSVLTSENQTVRAAGLVNSSVQVADAVTERARLKVVKSYRESTLSGEQFIEKLRDDQISDLQGVFAEDVAEFTGHWKISGLSDQNTNNQWIDISATAVTAEAAQTVIRRISLSTDSIFELAMLSEKTDCLYCHVRINGDVGQFTTFRPGWGSDGGSGVGSGANSIVNGTVYLASNASNDDSGTAGSQEKVNGALFDDVQENYSGDKLPSNDSGVPQFPPLNRARMQRNANGTLTGGSLVYGTPASSSALTAIPASSNSPIANGSYNGNLILVGTQANPIQLDGDIYVSGDVIIKGYVTGRGAIYSGRNTYIAGDIININPSDKPNDAGGLCASISDPDLCAQANIEAGKDELRIGARGNVIMGDYTETKADGSPNRWRDLQGADYFRDEFGLQQGKEICYRKDNGDELSNEADPAVYKDVDGNVISSADRVCTQSTDDPYTYSMRPGKVKSDGSFEQWLSDGLYQELLGTEDRAYDQWRYPVDRNNYASEAALKLELQAQLEGNNYNLSDASLSSIASAIWNGNGTTVDLTTSGGDDDDDSTTVGRVNVSSNGTIRVILDPAETYTKQTTHVDAFLYANQRIANKTFNSPLVINGGMIAKNIGILAPGLRKQGWMNSRYDFLDAAVCDDPNNLAIQTTVAASAYNADSDDCRFTINYDHRLKNGGYGFNLVAAEIGQTLSWRLADKLSDRVTP